MRKLEQGGEGKCGVSIEKDLIERQMALSPNGKILSMKMLLFLRTKPDTI